MLISLLLLACLFCLHECDSKRVVKSGSSNQDYRPMIKSSSKLRKLSAKRDLTDSDVQNTTTKAESFNDIFKSIVLNYKSPNEGYKPSDHKIYIKTESKKSLFKKNRDFKCVNLC